MSDFWSSVEGIATRIADISHMITWQSLNDTLRGIFFSEPTANILRWTSAGDDRVCPECQDGEGSTYTEDDPLIPDLPNDVHTLCRCFWTIVSKENSDAEQESET